VEKAFGLVSSSSTKLPLSETSSSSSDEKDDGISQDGSYDWCVDSCGEAQPKQTVDDPMVPSFIEYMDESKGKHVRLYEDGSTVECTDMVEGPSGFLVASWPDGSFTRTEVPALLMPVAVFKKPASKSSRQEAKKPPPAPPIPPTENVEVAHDAGEMADVGGCSQPKKKAAKKACDVQFEFPANRFELFPNGCAKCRGRKGCTRSCWIYRLKLHM